MRKPPKIMPYFGGKYALAPWILSFIPPHETYVEPFGGAANVLIQKPISPAEIYNDLSNDIYNLFEVLRNPETRAQLIEQMEFTPYSREVQVSTFDINCKDKTPVERARAILIRMYMGFRGTGLRGHVTGFEVALSHPKTTSRAWGLLPKNIRVVGERFKSVILENKPAAYLLDRYDQHAAESTVFYLDPPYVHDTRGEGSTNVYLEEMSNNDHEQLIKTIANMKSMVVLSGYNHPIYDDNLVGWRKETKETQALSSGKAARVEVLYINPQALAALEREQRNKGLLRILA